MDKEIIDTSDNNSEDDNSTDINPNPALIPDPNSTSGNSDSEIKSDSIPLSENKE